MKYKITVKNHFKGLETAIAVILLLIVSSLYLKFSSLNYSDNLGFNILIICIPLFLPVLYLHLEYYYYNRGVELEISSYEKSLSYTNKLGIKQTYSFNDLAKIELYMAPSWHRGSNFQLMPFEQYHYARIYTKNDKEIIVTCLLVQRVQDAVKQITGIPLENKKTFIASILWYKIPD
jgi:hypothetical protein